MKTSTILGLVGGVVVIGVGAVALTRKSSDEPTPSKPGVLPAPPPGSKLVYVTNTPPPPALPTISLKKDQYYRGRMVLKFSSLSPFNASAEEDTIRKGLIALGFDYVRVFMKISDLTSDWPSETTLGSTPETRWFQGRWTGLSETMPNPLAFEMVWVTRSPALVLSQAAKATTSGFGLREVGCG